MIDDAHSNLRKLCKELKYELTFNLLNTLKMCGMKTVSVSQYAV